MEKWAKNILLEKETFPFSEITDFLEDFSLDDIDIHAESWETFLIHLKINGFDNWSNDKKQASANTYFYWKTGYRAYSPWYMSGKNGVKRDVEEIESQIIQDAYSIKKQKRRNLLKNDVLSDNIDLIESYIYMLSENNDTIEKFKKNVNIIELEFRTKQICELLKSDERFVDINKYNAICCKK